MQKKGILPLITPEPTPISTNIPKFNILFVPISDSTGGWLYFATLYMLGILAAIFGYAFKETKDNYPSGSIRYLLMIITGFFYLNIYNCNNKPSRKLRTEQSAICNTWTYYHLYSNFGCL
jgi:hypothetical protein